LKLSKLMARVLAAIVFPIISFAAPYEMGQVFASVGNGQVKVFSATGTLIQTLNTTTGSANTTGGAFDAAGNFYVTNFQHGSVSKFDSNGNFITNILDGVGSVESISINKAGNLYVGRADGDADVRLISPTGTAIDQFNVAVGPRGSDWIDLAADQSTLFYTSEGSTIRRYDVSTDTQLTDFGTVPGGQLFALRILGDGGVLAAGWTSGNVYRFNSAGTLTNTFNIGGTLFALNIDPDDETFWTADFNSGLVTRARISDGSVVTTFNSSPFTQLAGLAVFGEIRQGGPPTVPEPSTFGLVAAAFAGLAWRKARSRRA
jgi:sugar lactone lactonase YvrE